MTRRTATALHVSLVVVGAALFFLFVVPRWWVLTGAFPSTLATAGRIAAGVPIALAAIPVLAVLKGSIAPSAHAPELALRLRAWSALLHGVAGGLILLVAIIEIWLSMPAAAPWLFALYGAAGAIAALGVLAFHLSYDAEKPPVEPKPARQPKAKKPLWRKRGAVAAETSDVAADETLDETVAETDGHTDETSTPADKTESDPAETIFVEETEGTVPTETDAVVVVVEEEPAETGGLRNKRPTGKRRMRLSR